MDVFVSKMMGGSTNSGMGKCECKGWELARMLYFLMVAGYNLRRLEIKYAFEQTYDSPPPVE